MREARSHIFFQVDKEFARFAQIHIQKNGALHVWEIVHREFADLHYGRTKLVEVKKDQIDLLDITTIIFDRNGRFEKKNKRNFK